MYDTALECCADLGNTLFGTHPAAAAMANASVRFAIQFRTPAQPLSSAAWLFVNVNGILVMRETCASLSHSLSHSLSLSLFLFLFLSLLPSPSLALSRFPFLSFSRSLILSLLLSPSLLLSRSHTHPHTLTRAPTHPLTHTHYLPLAHIHACVFVCTVCKHVPSSWILCSQTP